MRKVASYCLTADPSPRTHDAVLGAISNEVGKWLAAKGTLHEGDTVSTLELKTGEYADLATNRVSVQDAALHEWVLTEPSIDRQFRTAIRAAATDSTVAVSCTLEVGAYGEHIVPLTFDARTPHIVRTLINLPKVVWSFGGDTIPAGVIHARGQQGGEDFVERVWNRSRSLPVLAVSQDHGVMLHPDIGEMFAFDLAGLAAVVTLDSSASWHVTNSKGKEWSVYGGALRIYWPNIHPQQPPFSHQLWLPRALLAGVADASQAVDRIRRQIRRLVLGMSAFSVFEPTLVEDVRRRARRQELDRLRTEVQSHRSDKQLADDFFNQLVATTEELDRKNEEIEDLRRQLGNLQETLRWTKAPTDETEVPAEAEAPPTTIAEAVAIARTRLAGLLVFGAHVDVGVAGLAPDAGPPPKVLQYLEALAELAAAMTDGNSLGNSVMGWLQERGISASGERELVRENAKEMQARTWDNGSGSPEKFEHHLKPNEATAPDRCVRIYFRAIPEAGIVIVGWIGRHP